ncbi:MAG: peptidoglycan-binding protein [Oscillospiraceae bacterium]|jgi:cell wall-associated NlpC family hydrolase|nr:peptidoglycan-binding protein [Oscillospiraceae bacterium]
MKRQHRLIALISALLIALSITARAQAAVTALRPGDEGPAVEVLQQELMRKGFYTYPQITGYYGAETELAVRQFQQSVKLARDGVAGKVTLKTLFGKNLESALGNAALSSGSPSLAKAAKEEESRPDVITPRAVASAIPIYGDDGSDDGVLKKGQTGSTVLEIQRTLVALGYLSSADGEFGSQTESAVMSFQIASGLSADGQVGPRTLAALSARDAITAEKSAPSLSGQSGSRAAQAIAIAKQFLGAKYVYATAGPTTFDCSGLTLYVFKQLGFTLPHTTRLQCQMGSYVDYENLQMGDLVFFDTVPGNGLQYDHVGIYIANGQFIHAASGSTGKVTISSLTSGYYRNAFTNARRLL